MKKKTIIIALVLAMFLTGCGVGGNVEPQYYSVSGRVVDSNGDGIPDVTIGFSGSFGIATTNSEGKWSKDGLRDTVTITPVKDGWVFESRQVSKRDQNVDFVGIKRAYPLTVLTTGDGTVDEEQVLSAISNGYEHGAKVRLTAIPEIGWRFSHWEGDIDGNTNPVTIVVDKEKCVTAVFVKLEYALNVTVEGEGTVDEEVVLSALNNGYEHGAQVRLTAIPEIGWRFSHWEGDVEGNVNPATIIVDKEQSVTAVFEEETFIIEVSLFGEGKINISPTKESYKYGEEVSIVATPNEGWYLDSWTGDLYGIETVNKIVMDNSKYIELTFSRVEDIWQKLGASVRGTAIIAGRIHGWRAELTRSMPYDINVISLLQIDQNGRLISEISDVGFYQDYDTVSVDLTYDITPPLYEDWLNWVFLWQLEFQGYQFMLWGR